MRVPTTALLFLIAAAPPHVVNAFSAPRQVASAEAKSSHSALFRSSDDNIRKTCLSASSIAASAEDSPSEVSKPADAVGGGKKEKRRQQIRSEGGIFAFNTKYGALNPYGIYYGLTAILLGLPWFVVLTACQLVYFVTGDRFDKKRRLPVFFSHVWGTLLLRLTRNFPVMENRQVLLDFYKSNRAAMFVANHNSWMDIPFLGATIGWRNYKIIAKKELEKVPILGKAIKCAKDVCVDRTDRRSQLLTLKSGMQWLKDGVHLCTFPEGTRSRSGRLMKFKNGAFKMAHKMQAPVIPLSIVAAGDIMPPHWMFPMRPGRRTCKVVVHEPIESNGKTEVELAEEVRKAIISGLPEEQRPAEK